MHHRFLYMIVCLLLLVVFQPILAVSDDGLIGAGYDFTCQIKADGTVACWGDNTYGQLTPPAGTFTQITGAYLHACGLRSDGTVECWGMNDDFESISPEGTFTQISAGSKFNCGVQTDATLACWGSNYNGESTPPAGTFTQVSAGTEENACGLKTDGTVACWGKNDYGQGTPPDVTFTQVSTGSFHACGLKSDGSVTCWGSNFEGQLNAPAETFTQISAGAVHNCGLKSDGTVTCWGANWHNQTNFPAGTFTQVIAGNEHTCAIKPDTTLACWGLNTDGQVHPFTQIAINGGFETDIAAPFNQPDGWTVKNKTKDKRVCNTDELQVAAEGNCAYLFKGTALENMKLIQTPVIAGLVFNPGDEVGLNFQYNVGDFAQNLKVKVIIYYTDQTTDVESTVVSDGVSGYSIGDIYLTDLFHTSVSKIKIQFNNRVTSGKLYIDDVQLWVYYAK